MRALSSIVLASTTLCGCALPPVNLATSEPIKVDISMRLDVYQHSDSKPAPKANTTAANAPQDSNARISPETRSAEIQVFKNSRVVGEGSDGLLVVLGDTPGEYGSYIRRVVASENSDRMRMMKKLSDNEKRSLPQIQKEQAELWRTRSFKGEWIQVPQPDGAFTWVQKEG